jgi:dolichol kinase
MNRIFSSRLAKRVVQGLLLAAVVLYGVSGLGISEFRFVETVTFGLLTKPLAFKIHDNLLVPFLVLLVVHICQRFIFRPGEHSSNKSGFKG